MTTYSSIDGLPYLLDSTRFSSFPEKGLFNVVEDSKDLMAQAGRTSGIGVESNQAQNGIRRAEVLRILGGLLYLTQFILFIFFYNVQANPILIGLGWILLPPSFLLQASSMSALNAHDRMANSDVSHPTNKLVETSVYSVIRHPLYLGWMMMSIVLTMMLQTWISVALTALQTVAIFEITRSEELGNSERFGSDYASYQERVPKVNLLVGFYRYLNRRSREF